MFRIIYIYIERERDDVGKKIAHDFKLTADEFNKNASISRIPNVFLII